MKNKIDIETEIADLESAIINLKKFYKDSIDVQSYIIEQCHLKSEDIDKARDNADAIIDFLSSRTINMGELIAAAAFSYSGSIQSLTNMLTSRLIEVKQLGYQETQAMIAKDIFDSISISPGKVN